MVLGDANQPGMGTEEIMIANSLHSLVGLSGFRCIVADLFLLTYHAQCTTMAEMKGYRHE